MALASLPVPINASRPGYGLDQQVPVVGGQPPPPHATPEQLSQWMAAQPWFQKALQSWNVDPRNPALSIQQRAQLADAASRAGADLSGGYGVSSGGGVESTAIPLAVKIALAGFGAAAGGVALGALAGTGGTAAGVDYGALATVPEAGAASGGLASTAIAPVTGALASGATGSGPAIASTVAPAAAAPAAAGSWLTSPYMGLAAQGLNVFGQIYGANKADDSNTEAAQIQAASFDKALAAQQAELYYQHGLDTYKQNQFGSYLSRLQPYQSTGEQANDTLAQFMGTPRTSAGTQVTPQTQAALRQPPAPAAPAAPTMPAQSTQPTATVPGGTVTLKAPNGSTKDVPAAQLQYWLSKGATQVPAATRLRPEGQV